MAMRQTPFAILLQKDFGHSKPHRHLLAAALHLDRSDLKAGPERFLIAGLLVQHLEVTRAVRPEIARAGAIVAQHGLDTFSLAAVGAEERSGIPSHREIGDRSGIAPD